jgi:DNA-binding response OmpR family regulator
MSTRRDGRACVLIIHENPRIAQFLEGVVRAGFRPRVVMDCFQALDALRIDTPEVILCDIKCLAGDETGFLVTMREEFDCAQVPLIVVTGDHPTQQAKVVGLPVGAIDAVRTSISPRLLNWKVANWLHIKQETDRILEAQASAEMQANRFRAQAHTLVHDLNPPLSALRYFLKRLEAKLVDLRADARTVKDVQRLQDIGRSIGDILDSGRNAFPKNDTRSKYETLQLDALAIQVVQQHHQPI